MCLQYKLTCHFHIQLPWIDNEHKPVNWSIFEFSHPEQNKVSAHGCKWTCHYLRITPIVILWIPFSHEYVNWSVWYSALIAFLKCFWLRASYHYRLKINACPSCFVGVLYMLKIYKYRGYLYISYEIYKRAVINFCLLVNIKWTSWTLQYHGHRWLTL